MPGGQQVRRLPLALELLLASLVVTFGVAELGLVIERALSSRWVALVCDAIRSTVLTVMLR